MPCFRDIGMDDASMLQFPCDFPIKIMGGGSPDFRQLVVELVSRHAPDLDEARISVRESRAGRYQSVTVVVNACDRAQLDALYRELSRHPRITMVL
jgi:putative lipoic acid-binding regulatory protein